MVSWVGGGVKERRRMRDDFSSRTIGDGFTKIRSVSAGVSAEKTKV